MSFWIEITLILIVLSIITMVIAENRHPIRTLAWILVLVCLPGLGLVLYFFFGKDNRKKRLVNEEDLNKLKTLSCEQCSEWLVEPSIKGGHSLVQLFWRTNRAYLSTGNDLRVYTDFDSMFNDMVADLEKAGHHIHFEFFKFEEDRYGKKIAEILIRKAREGVAVRFQYDDAANLGRKRFYRRMAEGGVQMQPFCKIIIPFLSSNTNYRNHRKVVVVDGKVGYLGGMNIAERYSTGVHGGPWRDTHCRIVGPAVSELQTSFLIDWRFSAKELLASPEYYPPITAPGDKRIQIVTSGPMDEWRVIMQGIVRMISHSREYVYIQSPYLIPTEPVLMALKNAGLSGVDVRIMLPYRGDRGMTVPLASRSYVKEVIAAGVKVYFTKSGYLHSKTIVSDDKVVTIGSTNMDMRSFEQDFEINSFIYDEQLAKQMKAIFIEDQKNTWLVEPEKWAHRPLRIRFVESLARLLSPLL